MFDSLWACAIFISELVETTSKTVPSDFIFSASECDVSTVYRYIYTVFGYLRGCLFVIFTSVFTPSEIMHKCPCLSYDVLLCGAAPRTVSP